MGGSPWPPPTVSRPALAAGTFAAEAAGEVDWAPPHAAATRTRKSAFFIGGPPETCGWLALLSKAGTATGCAGSGASSITRAHLRISIDWNRLNRNQHDYAEMARPLAEWASPLAASASTTFRTQPC